MKFGYPSNKTRQENKKNYRRRQKQPQETVYRVTPCKKSAEADRRYHNGADVTLSATEAADGDWWKTTAGWSSKFGTSETAPWKWDSGRRRPVLWFE